MSRQFSGVGGLYNSSDNLGITTQPYTIFFWAKLLTGNNYSRLFQYMTKSTDDRFVAFRAINDDVDLAYYTRQAAYNYDPKANDSAINTWLPVFMSLTDTTYTLNVNGNTTTSAGAGDIFSTDNSITIGSDEARTGTAYVKIAHFTTWNAEVTGSDITSLIGGSDPSTIDTGNLTRYWSFTNTSLTDSENGIILTDDSSTYDSSDNPPMSLGSIVPQATHHYRANSR